MVFGQYYQFGLAVSNLLQTPLGLESEPTSARNRGVRHYALTGRYDYKLDGSWTVQPALMMRFTEITPIQLDLHARALYQNRYWGGLGFRQGDALVMMVGAAFQDIQVGYSYDAGTGCRWESFTKHPRNHGILRLAPSGSWILSPRFGRKAFGSESDHQELTMNMLKKFALCCSALLLAGGAYCPIQRPRCRGSGQQRVGPGKDLPRLCPNGGRRGCGGCHFW